MPTDVALWHAGAQRGVPCRLIKCMGKIPRALSKTRDGHIIGAL